MFWLLESWRWNCSPSRATRVSEITEKELYTSEYFNLKIKCTGTFKLTFVPMNGAWFSLKWRAHASTKKGNAENGRSILLTIPTKRCLASYSSSAESKRLRIRAMLGYPDSGVREILACGFRNPRNFFLWNLESWALESGIYSSRNPESINDWNPGSKFHWQILESSTWNLESKTVLDSLTLGDRTLLTLFARPGSNAVLHNSLT